MATTAIRHTFRCNVINFVVHSSPVYKFADASEGVGHKHKLTKLVRKVTILYLNLR